MESIAGDPLRGKLLFAAKEAVYKAVYPLDGVFLNSRTSRSIWPAKRP